MIAVVREQVGVSAEPALDGLMLAIPAQPGARRLRDALSLGQGFEFHLVSCATPRVARALLAWLTSEFIRLASPVEIERIAVQLAPDGAIVDGQELAEQLLGALAMSPESNVARFVDASAVRTVDLPAWEWFAQRLNERRNLVAAAAPCPLVLLLAPPLARSLALLAPDLWSVRSVDIAIGDVAGAGGGEPRSVDLASWVLDGDDPEALRAELRALDDSDGPHTARARLPLLRRLARAASQHGDLALAERVIRDEWIPRAEALGADGEVAVAQAELASVLVTRGDRDAAQALLDQALATFERLGDPEARADTLGKVADIVANRGDLDEALRIRREEQLSVYERQGAVRSRAITLGQVADILTDRGDLDEALRIHREQLPVYERLGDVRSRAVTLGKVADILAERGDLDEALRIHREQLLVYERLGDVRSRAVSLGKVATILAERGDLDEALRIHREQLPVYERLGDVRSRAVALGHIAEILAARGDLDEALQIRREEVLPVYERGGGRDLVIGLANLGALLIRRQRGDDLIAARALLERAARMADEMKIPFPQRLRTWLESSEGRA